jgi:hypothetical protein
MNLFRRRAHHLITRLSDADLVTFWELMESTYQDLYMLRAIQTAKQNRQPGDTLTREEALEVLSSMPSSYRSR